MKGDLDELRAERGGPPLPKKPQCLACEGGCGGTEIYYYCACCESFIGEDGRPSFSPKTHERQDVQGRCELRTFNAVLRMSRKDDAKNYSVYLASEVDMELAELALIHTFARQEWEAKEKALLEYAHELDDAGYSGEMIRRILNREQENQP